MSVCVICHDESKIPNDLQISALKVLMRNLENSISKMNETIHSLCKHKNMQIDENRKISRRVDELEEKLKAISYGNANSDDHDERIHDLENICAETRLIQLEERINDLSKENTKRFIEYENNKRLEKFKNDKTPHKCPVCDGNSEEKLIEGLIFYTCRTCKGKGIVWV